MQKTSSATTNAGPVASPTVVPDKDMKDVSILGGLLLFLAIVVAVFWYYSQADEAAHSTRSIEALDSAQLSRVFKNPAENIPVSAPIPVIPMTVIPPNTGSPDIQHDDILFEISRKGLSDDGKAALQRHADFLKSEPDWGLLLTGYTDQQGSMSFNKILGQKRAETVKQHLIALGVPESAIRTVSLGEEGALCLDHSDVCRRMNRRVHLEIRKIGREHLVIPAVAVEPTAPIESSVDDSTRSEKIHVLTESPLQADTELSDTLLEPTTGH